MTDVVDAVLLLSRVALVAVLVVAAVAKLSDQGAAKQAVIDFGLPRLLAHPIALLIPPLELAIAAMLVAEPSVRWGAGAALVLLTVFSIAIGASIVRGSESKCHCFGSLGSARADARALARNALLAAVAALVLATGPAWASTAVTATLSLAGAVLLLHVLRVRRKARELEERLNLPAHAYSAGAVAYRSSRVGVRAAAPFFELSTLEGRTETLTSLLARKRPVLLVFADPSCAACANVLEPIERWQCERDDEVTVAVVSRGTHNANRRWLANHSIRDVLLQSDREVSTRYGAVATPSAVLVALDATIKSGPVAGLAGITALIDGKSSPPETVATPMTDEITEANGYSNQATVGMQVPLTHFTSLDGEAVVHTKMGKRCLILFWSGACLHCAELRAAVERWHAGLGNETRLVVICSSRRIDDCRRSFHAPVIHDPRFEVGRAFGALGTPSALFLDEKGAVGSPVAVGTAAIVRLIGFSQRHLEEGAVQVHEEGTRTWSKPDGRRVRA